MVYFPHQTFQLRPQISNTKIISEYIYITNFSTNRSSVWHTFTLYQSHILLQKQLNKKV